MSPEKNSKEQGHKGNQEPSQEKRSYEKPTCVSEGVFETNALTCGKTPSQCHGNPHSS